MSTCSIRRWGSDGRQWIPGKSSTHVMDNGVTRHVKAIFTSFIQYVKVQPCFEDNINSSC